ncbi:ATP-binding cassette domain-containing protein [Eisenibacter elegans]|jgi:putative ABC transport system ATP-binding protein|uniref:ATP-binding cassette domain-containing protein n=1 Tax=Eisenibacter elegans TaxID=997 RepID=UPI0003F543A0|nr:ATP-binding cassette domain-containing protein [Eisenibacter elegans]
MDIIIRNLLPAPLEGSYDPESQIWNQPERRFVKGQKYLLQAPSGRGKSSFIHTLYGIRQDYEGQVFLAEQNIQRLSSKQWADYRQRHLSIVFQDLRLFLELNAFDNIRVKSQLTQYRSDTQIKQMAEQLGIAPLLNKQVKLLSYGERQRVAIIRALCQPFEWLLMDEPFSHLDEDNITKAITLIDQVCNEQQAGFISTSLGATYQLPLDHQIRL